MPFCTKCGSEYSGGDLFCVKCGTEIVGTEQSGRSYPQEEAGGPKGLGTTSGGPSGGRSWKRLLLLFLAISFFGSYLALQGDVSELKRANSGLTAENSALAAQLQQKTAEVTSCRYLQEQTQQAVNELKAHILFRGGNATAYFTLLDGSQHITNYDIKSLNYYVLEGSYNRLIIDNYDNGYKEDSIKLYFGSDRTRRFYYKGAFSPYLVLKSERGKNFRTSNYLAFIDTGSVKNLANYIKEHSKNDLEFVKNVVYLKTQLNTYTYNLMKQPRYPLETFLEGGGDCGASSLFVGSMIKAAHPEWKVQFWYVNLDSISNPSDTIDHAIVYVDNGKDVKYFIETTTDDADSALNRYVGKQVYGWAFDFT